MKKHYIIPIFISHLGCPHTCVFCDQARINAHSKESILTLGAKDVLDTAEAYLNTIPGGDREVELSFFGGTFTGLPVKRQEELLSAAHSLLESGRISHIRCSTRPDFIDEEILDRCLAHGMDIIELGVQSLDDDVLQKSGRGHDTKSVENASRLIRERGIRLGHQIMPGLPGATPQTDLETAALSIAMAPDEVRIYPTLVVRGTVLADLYEQGLYEPYDLETAVKLTGEIMALYENAGIKIIRAGLQATEEISERGSLLAGPAHPAFRELALSDRLTRRIQAAAGETGRFDELRIHPKDLSILYSDAKRYFREVAPKIGRVIQDEGETRGQVTLRRREGNLLKIICI